MNDRLALLEQRVQYPEAVVVGGGYAGAPTPAAATWLGMDHMCAGSLILEVSLMGKEGDHACASIVDKCPCD